MPCVAGQLVASTDDGMRVVVLVNDATAMRCNFHDRIVSILTVTPNSICVYAGLRLLIIDPVLKAVRYPDGPMAFTIPTAVAAAVAAAATAYAVAIATADGLTVYSDDNVQTFAIPNIISILMTSLLYALAIDGTVFQCAAAVTIVGKFAVPCPIGSSLYHYNGCFSVTDAVTHCVHHLTRKSM